MPTSIKRYRVFVPENETARFPGDVTIEETYPAFTIVSINSERLSIRLGLSLLTWLGIIN